MVEFLIGLAATLAGLAMLTARVQGDEPRKSGSGPKVSELSKLAAK